MMVEVSFYAWQARVLGNQTDAPAVVEEELEEGTSFGALLERLVARYPGLQSALVDPASGQLYDYVIVMLNGSFLDPADGQRVVLRDGDRLQFLPFVAGG